MLPTFVVTGNIYFVDLFENCETCSQYRFSHLYETQKEFYAVSSPRYIDCGVAVGGLGMKLVIGKYTGCTTPVPPVRAGCKNLRNRPPPQYRDLCQEHQLEAVDFGVAMHRPQLRTHYRCKG